MRAIRIILLILLTSCGISKYELKPGYREHVESYYETKWNPWNNQPGEQDSIMNLIKKGNK